VNINKKTIGIYIIYNSFIFKSNGVIVWFFKFIPKTASNQHFEKPIKPKTLATKNKKSDSVGDNSNKPQKM
jgi:hypothetical protein